MRQLRVAVLGGSLGGLSAAITLRRLVHEVAVHERSAVPLRSRGAGIVVHGELLDLLGRYGEGVGGLARVPAGHRQYLDREGGVAWRRHMPQEFTSWGSIYRELRRLVPDAVYHQGHAHAGLELRPGGVLVRFESRVEVEADLVVAADCHRSPARRLLLPEVAPRYAGYVAWRGRVEEAELPGDLVGTFEDRFTFYHTPNGHILAYFIPGEGGDVRRGRRLLNWVWYVNADGDDLAGLLTDRDGVTHASSVPPSLLRDEVVGGLRRLAGEVLPGPFARLVAGTAEPFVQGIEDVAVPRMAFGRAVLLGDAAFVVRPHTAASTAKAAADAMALAEALGGSPDDLPAALAGWEARRLEAGRELYRLGVELGDRSQFGGGVTT